MRRTTLSDASRYSTITATRSSDTDERLMSSMLAVEFSLVMPRKEVRLKRSPTSAFEGSRGMDEYHPLSDQHLRLQASGASRRGRKEATTLDGSLCRCPSKTVSTTQPRWLYLTHAYSRSPRRIARYRSNTFFSLSSPSAERIELPRKVWANIFHPSNRTHRGSCLITTGMW